MARGSSWGSEHKISFFGALSSQPALCARLPLCLSSHSAALRTRGSAAPVNPTRYLVLGVVLWLFVKAELCLGRCLLEEVALSSPLKCLTAPL